MEEIKMATTPGILTDWPWKNLGTFKYIIMAPWGMLSIYSLATKGENQIDHVNLLLLPFLLFRALHNQIWISFSRHRTTKGNTRILDRPIEFDQVDRERNWSDGVIITMLLHAGPVEYLYYWLHRALHHHYLYSRYHSHHHSSIVTKPITSVIHPFAEHIAYFTLFAIPLLGTVLTGIASVVSVFGYVTYTDFMNNMGHCNFEFIPKRAFSVFPPLKYLMYMPAFHSLHNTQYRTNYSLFMPFYDYIHGTIDKSSDKLYETSLSRHEENPDVVHLTHLTTPESIFHQQVGFASFASRPQNFKWYMWLARPLTFWSLVLNFLYGRTFIVERNLYEKLKLHSWVIPRYTIQGFLKWQRQAINGLIEEAILEADAKGAKV